MKKALFCLILILYFMFNIKVHASDVIIVKQDPSSTYIPTNIVNGTFDEVPWMAFKFEGVTYSKEQLDGFSSPMFEHGDEVEIIYNGTNKGWNTTTNIIYDDGKLFDWTKRTNNILARHAIDATYNASLQTTPTYSFIEMNGFEAAVFFQDLTTKGGDVIRWTLNHGIRPTREAPSIQNISVEIGAPKVVDGKIITAHGTGDDLFTEIESSSSSKYSKDGVINGSSNSGFAKIDELKNLSLDKYSQDDGWYDARGVYVVPNNQSVTRFAFISDVNNGDGNMLDDITFSTLIGNLSATLNDDKTVTVSGYWGETDPAKKLVIKIGEEDYSLDMSDISGNFTFDISKSLIGTSTYIEVYHEDYKQVKKEVKIVVGKVNKKSLGNSDDIKILSSDEDIINSLDDESTTKIKSGEDVSISIEVNEITDTITDDDKEVFTSKLDEYELGYIYDVTLYKKLDSDEDNVKVTELKEPLEFVLELPNSLINSDVKRTYKILNYHDDAMEEINVSYDKESGVLRFKTKYPSRFAIIYFDEVEEKAELENPKTTDNISVYIVIGLCSLVGLSSLLTYFRKNN